MLRQVRSANIRDQVAVTVRIHDYALEQSAVLRCLEGEIGLYRGKARTQGIDSTAPSEMGRGGCEDIASFEGGADVIYTQLGRLDRDSGNTGRELRVARDVGLVIAPVASRRARQCGREHA